MPKREEPRLSRHVLVRVQRLAVSGQLLSVCSCSSVVILPFFAGLRRGIALGIPNLGQQHGASTPDEYAPTL
eukprot:2874705-Rhodomonas_salina.1